MQNNVVFLGCTQGYGYSFSACNTKVEFMARGLVEQGDICYIHNGTFGSPRLSETTYKFKDGVGVVVDYPCKGNLYLNPFKTRSLLIDDLKKWYRKDHNNVVILEAPLLPYYWLQMHAARKSGYKIAVISHEWMSTFLHMNRFKKWICMLYSKYFGYGVDAILPISNYIIERIKHFKKPYLKVPVEADFNEEPTTDIHESFFLYCVMADYYRVVTMVLNGYKSFLEKGGIHDFILVLAGRDKEKQAIIDYIEKEGLSDKVSVKCKLPFDELLNLYNTASGLIIPLDPEAEQDKARFSQKIAEYLSSGTPIISNDVGEIHTYFSDKENIILSEYSESGFANVFQWIVENPEKAREIGFAGYQFGKERFDYRVCGKELHDFLLSL